MKTDDEIRKQVEELLSAIEVDAAVVYRFHALGQAGRDYLVSLVQDAQSHPRKDLVHKALYVLGELGHKEGILALSKLVDSSDEGFQIRAIHALGRLDATLAEEGAFRILENRDTSTNAKGHALAALTKAMRPESTRRFQEWADANPGLTELDHLTQQILVDIGSR